MFYFGAIGSLFVLAGLISGAIVIIEWFRGITHVLLSVLTTLFIIFGLQMFIFGMLSDLIVTLHRQTISLIQGKK
jgi:dolichol-phosphate mannosyltransferase